MERIGNVGWFLSNEEYETIMDSINKVRVLLESVKTLKSSEGKSLTEGDGDMEEIKLNDKGFNEPVATPCPNCPWKGNGLNPWVNPADWTWRPWQAPWYVDPGEIKKFEIGDGEWWKHQPYCTSTTDDNPNVVKDTKTTGDGPSLAERIRNMAEKNPNPTRD